MSGTVEAPPVRVPGRGRVASTTVLAVACLGAFLAFLDATVVNVAFPSIRAHFGNASIGALSWVLNAYNIVLAATLVVFGALADLVGRRRMFSAGVAVFVVASLGCALAPSVAWLVAARGAQALGAAMLVPASLALVIQAFPPERRTHAVGLWGATAAAAAGLGPPVGGALVQWGDWRWAFLVNVPVGLVALAASNRFLVESRSPGRRRLPDVQGAVLVAAALGLLTTAIVTGDDWGWTSPGVAACALASLVATAAFVRSSRRHPRPLVAPELVRVRSFAVANAASTVAGLGFYAYLLTNVLWLQYVWRYDVLEAGLALVPAAVVAAVTAAVLGPVAERRGFAVVAVPGALTWALAYVWYATTVGTTPAFLSQWLPGQVLSGIGVGATLPILGSASLASVPGGRYAVASAVNSSVRQLGGVLGVALLVVLIGTPTALEAPDAFRRGWLFSAACFLACAVVAAFTGRPGQGGTELAGVDALEARLQGPVADLVPAASPGTVSTSLMAELGDTARAALRASSDRVVLAAGEVLFRAGQPADGAYAVVSGRVDVRTRDGRVRSLGSGGVIGELALLTGGTRSATVVARRDSVLERISSDALHTVLAQDPTAARSLAGVLAAQLAQPPVQQEQQPSPVTVAVVAAHRGAPAEAVAAALETVLRRWLRVLRLTGVDAAGLDRAEREHDRVLLVAADPDDTGWWGSAVRQADAVVAVALADRPADRGLSALPAGVDVVLVGAAVSADARAEWHRALAAWQVTGVERAAPDELAGLGSRLAGRSLGLVLAGGGARAFAHIGVLLALEESGVHVDRVAGASVGGIIAAMHAMGWSAEEVRDRAYSEFVRGRPFSDYTFPRRSLAKGQRMRRALSRHFGTAQVEGLPRQFRCVSTDLLAREVVVHRTGEVVPALMATAALPGLLPPVRLDGRLLVDGGVLDNLPVGALRERSEGPVVAVSVSMGGAAAPPSQNGSPRPLRTPALGETLLRTMLIGNGSAVSAAHGAGAIVLTPSAVGAGLLEFHQFDALVEAGVVAGRRLVEECGLPSTA